MCRGVGRHTGWGAKPGPGWAVGQSPASALRPRRTSEGSSDLSQEGRGQGSLLQGRSQVSIPTSLSSCPLLPRLPIARTQMEARGPEGLWRQSPQAGLPGRSLITLCALHGSLSVLCSWTCCARGTLVLFPRTHFLLHLVNITHPQAGWVAEKLCHEPPTPTPVNLAL